MSEEKRNQAEWENPENWHGGFFGVYRSEKDTRVVVPKRNPKTGWTFNFAKPQAYLALLGILLLVATISAVAILLENR
jgi:uncharacterized membrane protein